VHQNEYEKYFVALTYPSLPAQKYLFNFFELFTARKIRSKTKPIIYIWHTFDYTYQTQEASEFYRLEEVIFRCAQSNT
jgi:hypothetical protein